MPDVRCAIALVALLLAGCGLTSPTRREPVVVVPEDAVREPQESQADGASGTTDARSREPADECASVVPEPSWSGEPVFARGDPCENVRPGCAWSPVLRRCAAFTPVTACPATLEDARAAAVLCNHSEQEQLECRYGQTRCLCNRPQYCGGAPPPPTMTPSPATFVCIPPFDDEGCPTGEIESGAPCRLDASVECMSCSTVARCQAGRWQVDELPPRP